jgi:hypothetical protein
VLRIYDCKGKARTGVNHEQSKVNVVAVVVNKLLEAVIDQATDSLLICNIQALSTRLEEIVVESQHCKEEKIDICWSAVA